jgi:hypothetical protein
LAVFPGSLWFWRKEVEFQFCLEYCLTLKNATSELLAFLVSLPDPPSTLHLDKFDLEYFMEMVAVFKRQLEAQLETYVSLKGNDRLLP